MTQFENIELIYRQYINLTKEINIMIQNEDYQKATEKLKDKDKLTKRLSVAKKTTKLTNEENQKLKEIEEKLIENNKRNIIYLKKLKQEVAEKLKKTKKQVKISSAYSLRPKKKQGRLIDVSE